MNLEKTLNKNIIDRTENNCKKIIKQLFNILLYLHENNFCHRDIKLENIIYLPDSGKIILCDFGLANYGKIRYYTICGTPYYIAPEMWLGYNGYNDKIDVWSIGILICIFLLDYKPYQADTIELLAKKIINDKPDIKLDDWYNFSIDLRDFITRIFEKDPKKRPSIKKLLNHSWIKDN